MSGHPERLGDLFPRVLAELAATQFEANDTTGSCTGGCPICTTPPEMAFDLPWPAARWSPNAPAGVTDPADGTEHHP